MENNELFKAALAAMEKQGWGVLPRTTDDHCLAGWVYAQSLKNAKPLTRRQRINSKLRDLRYNLRHVAGVLRHPFNTDWMDDWLDY